MRDQKSALADLGSLGKQLPTKQRRKARGPQLKRPANTPPTEDADVFPECFAEVTRIFASKVPADIRHRTALRAVSGMLSDEARKAKGAQGAGIYLASLVTALRQALASSLKSNASLPAVEKKVEPAKKLTKKQRRMKQMRGEKDVLEMSAMDARAPQSMVEDATMTVLDSIPAPGSPDTLSHDAHFAASIVYLIFLAARAANRSLVCAKATDILSPINSALSLPGQSPLLARHAACAITAVLSSLDTSAWNSGSSHLSTSFINLLSIAASSNPKNRRKGRECTVTLLSKVPLSAFSSKCAPAGVVWFCRVTSTLAAECAKASRQSTKEVLGKSFAHLLHHVTVVKYFAFILNGLECAKVSKQLLVLAQNAIHEVLPFLYNSLGFMFCIPKNSADLSGILSARCAALIAESFGFGVPSPGALLGGEPPRISLADGSRLILAVVTSELPASSTMEARTSRVRALFAMAVSMLAYYQHSPPPSTITVSVVEALVNEIDPVSQSMIEVKQLAAFLQEFIKHKEVENAPDVFGFLLPFTTAKFKLHRNSLLPILKEFLSGGSFIAHPRNQSDFKQFLSDVMKMRNSAMSSNDRDEIELTDVLLSSVIRGGGAGHVLKAVPIAWDEKELVSNPWLIGILRDNIRYSPLSLWNETLLPLHQKLESAAGQLSGNDIEVERKNLLMYSHQILALLPGLGTSPSDLSHSQSMNIAFGAIHHCMTYGDTIVQQHGCNALRSLSESIVEASSKAESFGAGVRSSFSSRLKKLFPTVLSLAEKLIPDKRSNLMLAVSSSCRACADEGVVANLLRKGIRRFLEAATSPGEGEGNEMDVDGKPSSQAVSSRVRLAAADVCIAFIESGVIPREAKEHSLLKRAVLPLLDSKRDGPLQKKAYRTIDAMVRAGACTGTGESVKELVTELKTAEPNVAAGALTSRLSVVASVIDVLGKSPDVNSVSIKLSTSSFLPEAVLALRGNSEKSRQQGADLIKRMSAVWTQSSDPSLGLTNFFVHVAAGFGGKSTAMISGSLDAFSSLMQHYKVETRAQESLRSLVDSLFAQISADADADMLDADQGKTDSVEIRPGPIAILLRHDTLEVQRSAIGVLKSSIGPLGSPVDRLIRLLPGILPGLVATAANSKKKDIRLRVKVVIERLLRRCGREVMEGLFPEEHKRLLSSVRKEHEKEKAKRQERREMLSSLNNVENGDEDGDYDLGSDSDEEKDFLDGNELLARKQRQSARKARVMDESPGEVMDLLGGESVSEPTKVRKVRAKENQNLGVKTKRKTDRPDDNEKLVFVESDDEMDQANVEGSDDDSMDEHARQPVKQLSGRKRQRNRNGGDMNDKKRARPGSEYSSKRGAGDVKRAGKHEPYAYTPLGHLPGGPSNITGKGTKARKWSVKKK